MKRFIRSPQIVREYPANHVKRSVFTQPGSFATENAMSGLRPLFPDSDGIADIAALRICADSVEKVLFC
jgi:hypothetical protein